VTVLQIAAERAKIHWALDPRVASAVVADLVRRFAAQPAVKEFPKKRSFAWHGRSPLVGDRETQFKFSIGHVEVTCQSHDWTAFRHAVAVFLEDEGRADARYDGLFFKLHSSNHALCLSGSERTRLVEQVVAMERRGDWVAKKEWRHFPLMTSDDPQGSLDDVTVA
jgi:hypothetical protein